MDVTNDIVVAETQTLKSQIAAVRSVIAPTLNDQELQLFAMVAYRSRLDPFARQIHAVKRQDKLTFQTGIDGFRASAEDSGEYRGTDEPTFGPMVDKPYPHPEWARVVVHRQFPDGEWLHQACTVYWDEYWPGEQMGFAWKKMPRTMLAKCAEAGAFRRAFPKRFSAVYEASEMDQGGFEDPAPQSSARAKVAARRAQIEGQGEVVIEKPVVVASVRCGATSPYADDDGGCSKQSNHPGPHRNDNATWS